LDLIFRNLRSKRDADILTEKTGIKDYSIATIFAPGPDMKLVERAIHAFSLGTPEGRDLAVHVTAGEYILILLKVD